MTLVLSWLLVGGASILFLILFFYLRPRKLHLPPGPKPWPIIGNFNLISSLPHQSIHHLSQKYGPIMQLQFGSVPVVVASSSDMAKQFLKVHDLNFASRPRSSVGLYTAYDHSDIVFSPYNPYWRYARKICSMELFNTTRLDSYEYIRVEEMRNFLSDIYASRGKAIPLRDYFSNLTLNNITRIVLGKTFSVGTQSEEFKKMLKEMFFLAGVLNIGDFIPWLDFLDLQGYVKRFKAVSKSIEEFLEEQLNEHIAKNHSDSQEDMLDVLLKLANDASADGKLSRNQIKSITMDLLAGGTDTSTTVIEWAMCEILKRPEVIRRATEEIDRVIGKGRWVEEQDISNLPFIKAILYETLRMHPVSPLLAPHLARENCKIQGYDIVQGTQVLVNVWSIGRDPTFWDAPNEFRPERFIGRDIDVRGQHFELLPFGSGRRMCPGYSLGLKLTECGIANILHGFSWELANEMKPQDLNMDEVWGLTVSRKVQLLVVPQPRLPSLIYTM